MRIEALLGDQAWIKGLARSLVRDEALADDLVQEGWLRALRRPPARHVRSWWRQVLVRRAIDMKREEQRRRAREERVPAPGSPAGASAKAGAPSDDLLERVELQERVAHAVRELPEPYRGAVLLRYFEGLPPRRIARRLGMPVETVRTHLKRAHALLRERLDREGRDWKGTMLLLAFPGSIPKLVGGMVAMAQAKKLPVLALVLLLLSLSLFFVWRGRGGTGAPPRAGESARANAPAAVPAETTSPEAPAGWAIGVRTVGRDGTVVPGVEVEARVVAYGETLREERLTTDALGNAAWRLPAPGETVSLDLRAAGRRREVIVAAGNAPPETIELRIVALDGGITGRVLDARGEPIEGALVECSTGRATTGKDGAFSLLVPAETREHYVWARAKGYAFERVAVVLRDGRGKADLSLRHEFRIRGTVRDEDGRPVRGAIVRTFFTGFYQHAVSDREGRYALGHLDPGRNEHMLAAGHPAYAPFSAQVPTSGDEATVDVVLRRGLVLAGRVEGPDGKPVSGARLSLPRVHDTVTFSPLGARSGEDGAFDFGPRLEPGSQRLIVDHPSFAPTFREISLPPEGPLVIRLDAPSHVAGTAVDDLGRPIVIHVAAANGYVDRRAKSDATGRWRLEGIPAGPVELQFFGSGLQRTMASAEAGSDDVKVTVPRAATFKGLVVDDATGAPVASFALRVTHGATGMSATWVREGYRFDDPNGLWTIDEELAPGVSLGIEVRADGYAPGHGSAVAAIEPDPKQCVVRMRRGITIEGVVLDADTDAPIEGALVRVEPPGSSMYAMEETHRRQVQRTDADGRFRFPAMLPGNDLSVEHPGHAPHILKNAGGDPLKVRLHKGCVIEGTAGPGEEVVLICTDFSRDVFADDKGRFRFEHVPEGSYKLAKRIRLVQPPYTKYAYPVVIPVEAKRGVPADVALKPVGTATVRGTIEGSKEVDGTVVYLYGDGPVGHSVFVKDRKFELTGIPAGRYDVIPEGAEPVRIELTGSETREITLKPKD